jgi:hypothetical protein
MQHFRPDIWKQYISDSSGTTDQGEQHDIKEEYDECENSDDGAPMAVGEVVYQGGGYTCAHDDCMPCGSEMSVIGALSTILGRREKYNLPDTLSPRFFGRHDAGTGSRECVWEGRPIC